MRPKAFSCKQFGEENLEFRYIVHDRLGFYDKPDLGARASASYCLPAWSKATVAVDLLLYQCEVYFGQQKYPLGHFLSSADAPSRGIFGDKDA